MRLRLIIRTNSIGAILTTFLVGTLAGALTPLENRAATLDEWSEVFDTARAVLARMPDAERIETTIKDPGLREAVLRTVRALKACAKVNNDQRREVKQAALAEFERSFKAVETEAERSEYQACAAECKSAGATCEKECESARRKLCACKLNEFGSFMTKCVFG